jgi:hypothetical protein
MIPAKQIAPLPPQTTTSLKENQGVEKTQPFVLPSEADLEGVYIQLMLVYSIWFLQLTNKQTN